MFQDKKVLGDAPVSPTWRRVLSAKQHLPCALQTVCAAVKEYAPCLRQLSEPGRQLRNRLQTQDHLVPPIQATETEKIALTHMLADEHLFNFTTG